MMPNQTSTRFRQETGLEQRACRAAVVVPEFRPVHLPWDANLDALCEAFDVELIRVPRRFAGLRNADLA